jgi:hypothetical protein
MDAIKSFGISPGHPGKFHGFDAKAAFGDHFKNCPYVLIAHRAGFNHGESEVLCHF